MVDEGVREQTANLRREIRDLKTKLEEEKQDHRETSKELKVLKTLHEAFKTDTSQQIRTLAKTVQRLTGDSSSSCKALGNWRDSTKSETVTLGMEIEELTKTITQMIIGYQAKIDAQRKSCQSLQEHEELSKELKAANENHQREIEDLSKKNNESKEVVLKIEKKLEESQRDWEEIKKDLASERERVEDYQQKLKVKSKAADDLLKLRSTDAMKIESLQKELSEEKSKSETWKKQVQRLRSTSRHIPGRNNSYRKGFDRRCVGDDFLSITGNGHKSSDGERKAEDPLKNQVKRGTVMISGTEDKEGSWWRVDLTE
ncbi:PREDICTED: chromosome partition protein MukB-like, partial [Acropora digitifera]|uniref:chromosome partition protein MukB-like n=1 Tax=Acropora digitifera TaxID=70779 RepID=UPI00077A4DFB